MAELTPTEMYRNTAAFQFGGLRTPDLFTPPTPAAIAARQAAARTAATTPDFFGYGTPYRGGAGEGGVGLQARGYPLPPPAPTYNVQSDRQGDMTQVVHTPGLPAGATMNNVEGVNGVQRIVDAKGRTVYTNLGAQGYVSPSQQLPSVPGFLRGVKSFGEGATAAPASTPATDIRAQIASMLQRANALQNSESLFSKMQAVGLFKRAAALSGVYNADVAATQEGNIAPVRVGQLAVNQGQLGLDVQRHYPVFAQQLAINKLIMAGDIQGARRAVAALHGQNPDQQQIVQGPLGATTFVNNQPQYRVDMTGAVSEYDPTQQFPRFTPLPASR